MRMRRPNILGEHVPTYEHDTSRYPEQIRVSFDDGHTEIYDRRAEQLAPQLIKSIEIIRKWTTGYQYQPRRRRRYRR